jgi:translocation and assembly module TamB
VWSGGVLGALLLVLVAFAAWILFTTSGARWVAGMVTSRFAPQVRYASLDGTLAGALGVRDFEFRGPPESAQIRIAKLDVEPTLMMLFSRVLRIENARVEGLVLTLPEPKPPDPAAPPEPLWIAPPLEIVVDDFALVNGRVLQGRELLTQVRQLEISARWSADELVIKQLSLLPGEVQGTLAVHGRVTPAGKLVRGVLDASWKDVVVPVELAGRELASEGRIHFDGTPVSYTVQGELDVGPPGDLTHVVLDVLGTDRDARFKVLDLKQRAGTLVVRGAVAFSPEIGWDLNAKARDFDPGVFAAGFNGRVNLDVMTTGQMSDAGPGGTLRIDSLSGTLRGRPVAGKGTLVLTAPSKLEGDVELSSGRSRVAVVGHAAGENRLDATVQLAVASLNDWVPDTAGSLTGRFRVRGTWPDLTIAGSAQGRKLAYGDNRVEILEVDATVERPLDPSGNLRARAGKVSAAGYHFASVTIDATGSQARHRVAVDADGAELNAGVTLAGGLAAAGWSGELLRLELDAPKVPKLALREPAKLSVAAGSFAISRACLADERAELCGEAKMLPNGAIEASYSFNAVPLALANSLAPDALPGDLEGEVQGEGEIRRDASARWFGAARVQSAAARLELRAEEGAESEALGQESLLLYENLDLRANLEGERARATLTANLDHGGKLSAEIGASNLMAEAPTIKGVVNANVPTLAPFAAFLPSVANLDGIVSAEIHIGGTVTAPEFTGNAEASKLKADLGDIGVELREGALRAEAKAGGGFRLAGGVNSGKGRVEFTGSMSERGEIDARIHGENFVAANIPAANVIVSPDLTLTGNAKGYLLKGDLVVPRADINIQKMPQDEPPGVSPDVVVVRNGRVVATQTEDSMLPLTAVINVKLGDAIKVEGYGLNATVTGLLVVREAQGSPTTGSGTLAVAGRYKAYGQDLTIKEGRLLFAGTPLDNPRLAIVAMRDIDKKLSTGLRIAGSAQKPIITVVSDPNVGEADALSYLVTGRSLSDIGSASGSSQDTLASATRSLEGAGAGLIAKRIGQRLGIDEATVEENEMIGGSALTIGEYLSPRLYLSYGVGLFDPGEVIALRYKLTDDMGVKIERGSEETRAGVEYRIEK